MATRTIEITILSAENLQSNRKPLTKSSSVTVRTDYPVGKVYRTADTDVEGGGPKWNEKIVMDIPAEARMLILEVQCQNSVKTIGAAGIPVTEFTGGFVPEGYLHFLSYRLRDERGVRNGIVNVSVRMEVDEKAVKLASTSTSTSASAVYGRKVSSGCASTSMMATLGYPAVDNSAVVTGVPVNWKSYSRVQY